MPSVPCNDVEIMPANSTCSRINPNGNQTAFGGLEKSIMLQDERAEMLFIQGSLPTMKKSMKRLESIARHDQIWKWALGLLPCAILLAMVPLPAKADLVEEQREIRKQHPNVAHIGADQLEDLLKNTRDKVVLFDVREKPEFEVSHIEGSIRVDPGMTGEEFLSQYGDTVQNRKVVFYCSVGYRSSSMAEILVNQSPAHSSENVANLRYGLFGWHNQQRKLVNGKSPTDLIHPYNFWWGRLIERRESTSYKPK